MRIICDDCGQPVTGALKRMPEHLNFHPECLGELVKGTEDESTAISWLSQEGPVGTRAEGERRN